MRRQGDPALQKSHSTPRPKRPAPNLEGSIPRVALDDPLAQEVAALDAARAAMREERFGRAKRLLAQHRQTYPQSALSEDALKLSVVVSCKLGDTLAARRQRRLLTDRYGVSSAECEDG